MISNMHGRNIVGSHLLLRLNLAVLILMLFLAGSVGQARSAGSQQASLDYDLMVWALKLLKQDYLCIGEQMRIEVEFLYLNRHLGKEVSTTPIGGGITVTALVTGGTGTVTPSQASTQWRHDRLDSLPRTAVFNFKATKAGHEKIFFESIAPNDEGEFPPSNHIEKTLEFDVKKCKQKVNLIFDGQLSDEGVFWSGIGLIEDAIVEQGDDGVYRGSADFEFNVFNHATTDGGCVYQPHTAIAPAEITGQPNDDIMNWEITYADAQESVTATCVDTGSETFDNLQPLSEYGPSVVNIPSSGGAARYNQSWSWPTGGEFVTFTIIVEPEEESSVSKTSDSLTWLPDWFEPILFLP